MREELGGRVTRRTGHTSPEREVSSVPNNKDIWRNKVDHAREEFATELYRVPHRPRPREAESDEAQLESAHQHGTSKDVKVPMHEKDTR